MKSVSILLLVIATLRGIATAEDVVVRDPVLTLTGHYQLIDGRVSDHKFPVKIKLLPGGTFEGAFESWMELRLSDGSSRLSFSTETFVGIWKTEAGSILIIADEAAALPQIVFGEMNGITLKIERKKNS